MEGVRGPSHDKRHVKLDKPASSRHELSPPDQSLWELKVSLGELAWLRTDGAMLCDLASYTVKLRYPCCLKSNSGVSCFLYIAFYGVLELPRGVRP
jgi:hypothetical protein